MEDPDQPIKATLRNGKGEVVMEGKGLTLRAIEEEMHRRFPIDRDFVSQMTTLVVTFSNGEEFRVFRQSMDYYYLGKGDQFPL